MDTVQIFDTTLRDGEQSPGFSMNREEKLQLARQNRGARRGRAGSGFPDCLPGDLEATRAVPRKSRVPGSGARPREAGRRRCGPARPRTRRQARLHIFLATSTCTSNTSCEAHASALEQMAKMVRFGGSTAMKWNFPPKMPAHRYRLPLQVVLAVVESGATIINLPDTVGYSTPDDYAEMFRTVRARLGGTRTLC